MFSLYSTAQKKALDIEAIVTYNNFDNLIHYYSEMSAMGDRNPEFDLFGNSSDKPTSWGRIADVNIPFAVLQALDDPLVGWRTIGTNDPQGLADSGAGNVMLLLTKAGGHVVSLDPFFMCALVVYMGYIFLRTVAHFLLCFTH